MVRSLGTVTRINRSVGVPFHGLVSHLSPEQIGPNHCTACANVLLLHGRIRSRPAFVQAGEPLYPGRIESMDSFVLRDSTDDVYHAQIITKISRHDDIGTPNLYGTYVVVIENPAGSFSQYTPFDAFANPTKINGKSATFFAAAIGQYATIERPTASGDDVLKHEKRVYILDGSDSVWVTCGHQGSLAPAFWRAGLPAPTNATKEGTTTAAGKNLPAGTYEFYVSICNKYMVPLIALGSNSPGLEGNAFQLISNVVLGSDSVPLLKVHIPKAKEEVWNYIRIYGREVNTQANAILLYEIDKTAASVTEVDQGSGTYSYEITAATHMAYKSTTGDGVYDYPPTRNLRPEKFDFMAVYRSRAFYASRTSEFVYYSDIVSPIFGGHYEAISGEYLEPLDGPCGLLAPFPDQLVIGTSKALYIHTGALASHNNATAHTGADIQAGSDQMDRIAVDRGPIDGGTGSYVIADGALYYISAEGLEVYDGNNSVNLCEPIRTELEAAIGTDAAALKTAQLAHDSSRNIIYFLIRPNVTYDEVNDSIQGDPSPSGYPDAAFLEATYNASTIFCYHYRNRDSLTAIGAWTKYDTLGDGDLITEGATDPRTLIGVTSDYSRRRRYSAIAMHRSSESSRARLIVAARGMTVYDNGTVEPVPPVNPGKSYGHFHTDATLWWISYLTPRILIEDEDSSLDEITPFDLGNDDPLEYKIIWSYTSGLWDAGLIEREKKFHFLTVNTLANALGLSEFTVGISVDGSTPRSRTYKLSRNKIKFPIGAFGDRLQIVFLSTGASAPMEVLGIGVDVTPVGHY